MRRSLERLGWPTILRPLAIRIGSMSKWKKDLEDFRKEIHGGGTQEKLQFFLIDAIARLHRMTTALSLVLIVLAAVQVWLAWILLRLSVPAGVFRPFPT
jgi:hypothetical protein